MFPIESPLPCIRHCARVITGVNMKRRVAPVQAIVSGSSPEGQRSPREKQKLNWVVIILLSVPFTAMFTALLMWFS